MVRYGAWLNGELIRLVQIKDSHKPSAINHLLFIQALGVKL